MSETYPHIRRALSETIWAIHPRAMDLVVEIVARRVEGREPSAEEKATAIEAASRTQRDAPGGIAVIPVVGPIVHRADMFSEVSGMTSAMGISKQLRKAVADPDVGSILLDIDSPGGSVFGIDELAKEIYDARQQKPVWATSNAFMASAAYYVGSQAERVFITPSGEAGSIGVLAMHIDWSAANEAAGLNVTYITSAPHKAEGNPDEPLEDSAEAYMQKRVDEYHDMFVRAVARGRGVSPKTVGETFGQGRMVGAREAVELGMADKVATFREVVDEMASGARSRRQPSSAASARLRLVGA